MIKIARKLLNRFGFDVVRTTNNHNSFDDHLKNVLAKYAIDCVLDVGANAGQYAASLRRLGYRGWIVSFEPVRSVFMKLVEESRGDDKWICYNLALGEKSENKIINVYSSSVFSSFLDASDYSKGIWKSLETVAPEEVVVVRLDDLFGEILGRTGGHRFYLKMDTQGYDLNVFRGSLNSLGHIEAIQAELSLIHVYNDMLSPYVVLGEFHRRDYYVSGMYPINRDESMAVIEYDCVMVKKRFNTNA